MIQRCLQILALLGVATVTAMTPAKAYSRQNCDRAAQYSADHAGVSLLILKDGKPVCEVYANGGSATGSYLLASGTKSFSGIMAAAAAQDGFLTLDEPVAATITEWQSDPLRSRITVRQLLGLVSGIPGGRGGPVPGYAQAIHAEAVAEPGSRFQYGPVPFQIFGEVMKRKLAARGAVADPLDYLQRRILDPLAIRPASWRRSIEGDASLPSGAELTASQWARFGEFVRVGGRWGGKQLVDPATLAALFKSTPANPGYGVSWWLVANAAAAADGIDNPGDIDQNVGVFPAGLKMAAGAGRQRLVIVPNENMVVVRQTNAQRAPGGVKATRAAARGAGKWSDTQFLKLVLGIS